MKISEAQLFYFSPTRTSKHVVEAIAAGLQPGRLVENDLTHVPAVPVELPTDTVALFAVPVYKGRVAPVALERLREIKGNGTPAVLVVVYGNRDYEEALAGLDRFTTQRGFVTVAAATFIGEHSYSTPATPVAAKRPDPSDLEIARQFGSKICDKLSGYAAGAFQPVDVAMIVRPELSLFGRLRFLWYGLGLKISKKPMPAAPVTDPEHCNRCGLCVTVCPVGAIAAGDEWHTDAARCIRCCACVKGCRQGARRFDTPFARILSACCAAPKQPHILL